MQVYELITCVRQANENAGNLISVAEFLINLNVLISAMSRVLNITMDTQTITKNNSKVFFDSYFTSLQKLRIRLVGY